MKLIYFIILLLCLTSGYALQGDSASYNINFYIGSGGIAYVNTATYNTSLGMSQVIIGSNISTTYRNLFGMFYISAPNTTTSTTTLPPVHGAGAGAGGEYVKTADLNQPSNATGLNMTVTFEDLYGTNSTESTQKRGGYEKLTLTVALLLSILIIAISRIMALNNEEKTKPKKPVKKEKKKVDDDGWGWAWE